MGDDAPDAPVHAGDEDIEDELSCSCREAWLGFTALDLLREHWPAAAATPEPALPTSL